MIHFNEKIEKQKINYLDEYVKVNRLFLEEDIYIEDLGVDTLAYSLRKLCSEKFLEYKFKANYISYDEYESNFLIKNQKVSMNDMLLFFEFIKNILENTDFIYSDRYLYDKKVNSINNLMEYDLKTLRFQFTEIDGKYIIVNKEKMAYINSLRLSAEITNKCIEYIDTKNAHNIDKKRGILNEIAQCLDVNENREYLEGFNKIFNTLYFIYNNYNIRHNNKEDAKKNAFYKDKSDDEILCIYDSTYALSLIALNILSSKNEIEKISVLKDDFKDRKMKFTELKNERYNCE